MVCSPPALAAFEVMAAGASALAGVAAAVGALPAPRAHAPVASERRIAMVTSGVFKMLPAGFGRGLAATGERRSPGTIADRRHRRAPSARRDVALRRSGQRARAS